MQRLDGECLGLAQGLDALSFVLLLEKVGLHFTGHDEILYVRFLPDFR
jgi:hypothetical protein